MRRNFSARKLARKARRPSELLLVPMIDIFTVLVTFLLMTAVFSRTVIVELRLPTQSSEFVEPPPGLELEVLLRKDGLQVADRATGPLATFRNADNGDAYNLAGLSEYLAQVKAKYPEKTDATLLLEQRQEGQLVQAELFPNVSIGDAPDAGAPVAEARR